MRNSHKAPRGMKVHDLGTLPDNQRYLWHFASGPLNGFIYFVVSQPMQIVKIGATNRWDRIWPNIDARIHEICQSVPFVPVTSRAYTTPNALQMSEPELIKFFGAYRIEVGNKGTETGDNEWFQYTDVLKIFVDEVAQLNREHERYSREAEAYNAHVREQESRAMQSSQPMPAWPDLKPWRHLRNPPARPSRRIVSFRPIFEG